MRRVLSLLAAVTVAAFPAVAMAWGNSGHRIVGQAAQQALPAELPAFLRTARAIADVGELAREPDRSKSAGKIHDAERDPGHFVDVADDGTVMGGPRLDALPPTREDYDTALRAVGWTSWRAGYLPYSIVDRWQQLAHDFAYWRVLDLAEKNPAWAAHRAWYVADKRRREEQILSVIGQLAHFVGDGGQPLHVTIHFDGWGQLPNPAGYTTARVHSPFEGAFVQASVDPRQVAREMTPFRPCGCGVEQRTAGYLMETQSQVTAFYELEKAGGLTAGDPRGRAFATRLLARSASELRDQILEAWAASATTPVGYKPAVTPQQVARGQVDPWISLYGYD